MRFDISILLEPTSPLRTADDITATVAALIDGGCKAAATVSPARPTSRRKSVSQSAAAGSAFITLPVQATAFGRPFKLLFPQRNMLRFATPNTCR